MQILINIFISGFLYLLIATSFSLIYYPTKIFHVAHAVIITLGGYYTYLLFTQLKLPLTISILFSVILIALTGILMELIVYRVMRKKNISLLYYLIASLGIYIVVQNLISLYFGDDTKIIEFNVTATSTEIFGAYISTIQIITIITSIFLFMSVNLFFSFTSTGKSIKAVSNNIVLSNIYGINSDRIVLVAFAMGSILGGIAGILSAMDTNMTPIFGFNLLLYGIIAMIIGGVGSMKGLMMGSFIIASAQHLGAYYIDSKWIDAIAFIILIGFLIWKPLGFSGIKLKKIEI